MSETNLGSDPESSVLEYQDIPTAPMIYFDAPVAQGVTNGAIHIELAGRIMVPIPNSRGIMFKVVTTARLRCSPTAAAMLRKSIDEALKLAQQPATTAAGAAPTFN
jgi:hypothetical protein